MHADLVSNLQAPGQVIANLIDAVFPVGGAALAIYQIYAWGQSWFGAGQKAVGALGFLSRWSRDRRATPGAVSAWKAVRPLFLLVTAGLWVAGTYVQANLVWTFFVTESKANGQVNSKGMPALIVAQNFSAANLWQHPTPIAKPLIYFAVLALIIAIVSRRGWWVALASLLAGTPSGLLALFLALDAVVALLGALHHMTPWSSCLFATVGLAACCMYWWLCVIGLSSAKALGELMRPRPAAFS